MMRPVALVLALFTLFFNAQVLAAIEKSIRFESSPSGAEVVLLKGSHQIPLGKTPLVHTIKFHSKFSVLRVSFRRPGSKQKTIEIDSSQKKVFADLGFVKFTASPGSHKNEYLRNKQRALNKELERIVPSLLSEIDGSLDFLGKMRVTKKSDKTYLHIPVYVTNFGKNKVVAKDRYEKLLKNIWENIGSKLVIPIAKKSGSIDGIVFDAGFDKKRFKVNVSHYMEQKTVMECRAGYKSASVFEACARRVTTIEYGPNGSISRTKCQAGFVTRQVYNACASRVPVIKNTLKIRTDPELKKNQGRAMFLFPVSMLKRKAGPDNYFNQLSMRLLDQNGRELRKKGKQHVPNLGISK